MKCDVKNKINNIIYCIYETCKITKKLVFLL